MKFIDEALIVVQSGKGGDGCVSFRREKYVPRGGPDGGDGGRGGSVLLQTAPHRRTLYHFQFKRQFKAQDGRPGQGKQKTGRKGADVIIEVPPGTVVREAESGRLITDMVAPQETFELLRGGRGGKGNQHFKSAVRQTPRFAQPGESGSALTLKLELKLLADVGIVGLPNAGKSTLISVLSAARPKIADYPFTTLAPHLGVVAGEGREPFVIADIPGLIEGAHQGAGLGDRFLRHVERTRLLLHLIDASALSLDAPLKSYLTINEELAKYSTRLIEKPQLVVLNKLDLTGADAAADAFETMLPAGGALRISAATLSGIDALKSRLSVLLDTLDANGQKTVL